MYAGRLGDLVCKSFKIPCALVELAVSVFAWSAGDSFTQFFVISSNDWRRRRRGGARYLSADRHTAGQRGAGWIEDVKPGVF